MSDEFLSLPLKKIIVMNWINDLIWGTGIGHSVLLLSLVIAVGKLLGKVKLAGISLGSTFILFTGIVCGHFGLTMQPELIHFLRDFGLILFVYAIGMQVGPGFFSSFKHGGLTLNMLAIGIVFLGSITALVIAYTADINIPTIVGILSGAITNTPGLGAAQQALIDMTGKGDPTMAMGYAVAYPLGVVGIILSMIVIKKIFKVDYEKENAELEQQAEDVQHNATAFSVSILNPSLFGKSIAEVARLIPERHFIISRHWSNATGNISLAKPDTILQENDKIFCIVSQEDSEPVITFFGKTIPMERNQWVVANSTFINRRILVTKSEVNGKRLGSLSLRKIYGCNITRVSRSGVDLVANPELVLQIGDRVNVVGTENSIAGVEKVLGNSMKRLNQPNIISIFIGILLGVILGSIPVAIPGVPQPFKLGLAGGPLIVSILISRFGHKLKLVTYTTQSANLMLSEIGISIFLACVGINAGNGFIETVLNGGYAWIGYGFIITFMPLLIIGFIGKKFCKVNYFTLVGLIAGSNTDPPALAYANGLTAKDAPAVGYATVYPLTMFFRVLIAELIILFFA